VEKSTGDGLLAGAFGLTRLEDRARAPYAARARGPLDEQQISPLRREGA